MRNLHARKLIRRIIRDWQKKKKSYSVNTILLSYFLSPSPPMAITLPFVLCVCVCVYVCSYLRKEQPVLLRAFTIIIIRCSVSFKYISLLYVQEIKAIRFPWVKSISLALIEGDGIGPYIHFLKA